MHIRSDSCGLYSYSYYGALLATAKEHYLNHGYAEKRKIDNFNEYSYLAGNKDLLHRIGNNPNAALNHYINHGFGENRNIDNFDEYRYLASNPTLVSTYKHNLDDAARHYVEIGFNQGLSTDDFNELDYIISSSYTEGKSFSVIESLMNGIPCINSNINGIDETI